MLRKTGLRLIALLSLAWAFSAAHLVAQDSPNAPSVAEAARRARQQKQNASKPTTVLTNDNIPAAPDSTTNNAANAPTDSPASESQPASDSGDASKKDEIDALKKQIVEKQHGVDTLQREIALEQDNFYRKQDYQRDSAGKQKLDSMQTDLQTKQDELNALKAKLTDLAGAEALKSPAPTTPPAGTSKP
jgi:predicted RNase H-like nuclease (RuvC/YqgF family)